MIAEAWEENRDELDLNGDGVLSFALLEGERGHQDAVIRTEWVIRSLEEAGPWQMTESGVADWERDQATALSEQWLSLYGDQIELFICNNDDMALGVLDTLKKEERDQKIGVVGIDGTEEALAAVRRETFSGL